MYGGRFMAKMEWTQDQKKVIDLRKRNILVSAAAGSGKTAVLVERIITMISDKEHPIDIDQLLIVTFTTAAAAEMRERISLAIEERLSKNPDNTHLQKQSTLLNSAQIMTIHSFCLNLIKNHFNEINIDPAFRIGEDAELLLLRSDVLAALLEENYIEAKEEFLEFIESYSPGRSDVVVEEMILKLYEFSRSYPWSEEWLDSIKSNFEIESLKEMEESNWMHTLLQYLNDLASDLLRQIKEAIELCREQNGPYPYEEALKSDQKMIEMLLQSSTYIEYAAKLSEIQFQRLSSKRDNEILAEKKTRVKAIREQIKKTILDMKKNYFFQSPEEMLSDFIACSKPMQVLIELTKEFSIAYQKEKEEKNLVDFNDLEHFALEILVEKQEDGTIECTKTALELSEYYEEILIDEYQDSNLVQETILTSVSKERFHQPNMFMVGDVKQSIYKFRLARPELFMKKYEEYQTEDSLYQRINLKKNFRSRKMVLDTINYIFEQIMTKQVGNISYDADASLYYGAEYKEDNTENKTELILISNKLLEEQEEEEEKEYTKKELEAKVIANRIKQLLASGMTIRDKSGNRPIVLGDIVILLRSMVSFSEILNEVLLSEGILSYTDTHSGYFEAVEVRVILSMLQIIDNPRQDLSLVAVLRSTIGEFSNKDLAMIRCVQKSGNFYEAILTFIEVYSQKEEESEQAQLSKRLQNFLEQLEGFRESAVYLPIHELILSIYDQTGYRRYVSATKSGERRVANLDMLVKKAVDFEASSYKGLFQFNRYIEKLNRYEIDFGEAAAQGKELDAVRIMSIHKSKGLEFPIVFVAGLGKNFNTMDTKNRLLIHPEFGIGPDYIDYNLRIKSPTLLKKVIQKQITLENLGEELRILYVAMTRAKEKLILTGLVNNLENSFLKWNRGDFISYQQLTSAATFFDYIIPAILKNKEFDFIAEQYDLIRKKENQWYDYPLPVTIQMLDLSHVLTREIEEQMEQFNLYEGLEQLLEKTKENEITSELKLRMEQIYPFENDRQLPVKMTVSELKKESFLNRVLLDEWSEQNGEELIKKSQEWVQYIPKFYQETRKTTATAVGTLYHTVLERIDFIIGKTDSGVKSELYRLVEKEILSEQDIKKINRRKIRNFLNSHLAKRILESEKKGLLKKEQPFVIGLPACELNEEYKSEELILIQGVVDAYFEEENGIVLVDYKTDHVVEEEVLKERYMTQFVYYKKALEQITGKQVNEQYIYSFALEKTVVME